MGLLRDKYYITNNTTKIDTTPIANAIEEAKNKELEVRDRVDISKKEYLELIELTNKQRQTISEYKNTFDQLANFFKLPFSILKKAKNIKCDHSVMPLTLGRRFVYTFEVDDIDLRNL